MGQIADLESWTAREATRKRLSWAVCHECFFFSLNPNNNNIGYCHNSANVAESEVVRNWWCEQFLPTAGNDRVG